MSQLSIEGTWLHEDIVEKGYSVVAHDIPDESIDALIQAYASFTDNLPDPEPETIERMIIDQNELDEIDYSHDKQEGWHKYRTHHPQFAKPGGYTNRSLEVAVLKAAGRSMLKNGKELKDDPKEYYHFHPDSLAIIGRRHVEFGWGSIPPEVISIHMRAAAIHTLARLSIANQLKLLEESHPELISSFARPTDLLHSPLRLVIYHRGQGDVLAEPHYDKSTVTEQLAESHAGLRIQNPETGDMERVSSSSGSGLFFPGKLWDKAYPDSALKPGWHDVINLDEPNDGRRLYGENAVRWALIFFANSQLLKLPTKDDTHQIGTAA